MNFDLDADQVALRDGIRSLVAGRFGMDRVRRGFDRTVHTELAEAGVFSLRADGFTWADATIVFEELGRALVPGPLAWCFGRGPITGGVDVTAGGDLVVEHLDALDELLVLDDAAVRAVDPATVDATRAGWPLDPLTPVWNVLSGVHGVEVGGRSAVTGLRVQGALLTAAYLVGMAGALTDLAVAYAKEREQFDRPIGSFQAVKHLCADMAVRAEVARVATHAAACVLDDPTVGDGARSLAGAKLLANEAAVLNGRSATQVHGGMGFTWEVDVHLYLKRAWALDTVFGSVDSHADLVAATLPGSL